MDFKLEEYGSITYDHIVAQTEKAVLIAIDGREQWFPRSVCHIEENIKTVWVKTWFIGKYDYLWAYVTDKAML